MNTVRSKSFVTFWLR